MNYELDNGVYILKISNAQELKEAYKYVSANNLKKFENNKKNDGISANGNSGGGSSVNIENTAFVTSIVIESEQTENSENSQDNSEAPVSYDAYKKLSDNLENLLKQNSELTDELDKAKSQMSTAAKILFEKNYSPNK